MNRPFYAFGMLLVLLVATTWAVNSGSRWTTRREARPAPAHRHSLGKHPGGAAFILVLPEQALPPTVSHIRAARILVAPQMASLLVSAEPVDCLSHGDPVYDFAVYGVTSPARAASPSAIEAERTLQIEEMIQLFAALSASGRPPRLQNAVAVGQWGSKQWMMYAWGLRHWADRQVDRLPLVWLARQLLAEKVAKAAPVSWSEYAALIDARQSRPFTPQATTIQLAETGGVQSGHWLRYSAASTLNHLAHLLEWTADRLQGSEELVSVTTH